MKTYVATTGAAFGLLALVHIWRMLIEGPGLLRNPWWVGSTLIGIALCAWACRILVSARGGR